jgi:hypothetical protein
MDRQELIDILQELDRRLSTSCDVVLVGGAAMILHFGASRATRDVDILLLRGDLADLRLAATKVAHDHNLPEDWLNDAVKGFADILPRDFYLRLVPLDIAFQHVHLYVLGSPDQAAMKIVALREQDLEDLEILLPRLSEADKNTLVTIMHHVSTFRPDWAQRIRYFLLEQGWDIE